MDITVLEHTIPVSLVRPAGRVDAFTAGDLRDRCDGIITRGGSRIVIDLSAVTFLDSAGLAALVAALKRARAAGGDVKLAAPRDEGVWRIFRLTRFDHVFDIREEVDDAIDAFSAAIPHRPRR